ncbi:ATP-binding protein [Aliikangiella sp. IMCC44632]
MQSNWFIPFIVIIVLLTSAIYVDHVNNQNYLFQQQRDVANELSIVRAKLEGNIFNNIQTVRGLVGLISNEPNLTQERFAQYVEPLLQGKNQIRNIGAAPDLVMTLMYPLEGNRGALGLDFNKIKSQRDDALKARDLGDIVLAGPVNLVQGGEAFIGRIPIFANHKYKQQPVSDEKVFWGLISAVIDIKSFYQASGLNDPDSKIEVAISWASEGSQDFTTFYGDHSLHNAQSITSYVNLPNKVWQLDAIPKGGWQKTAPNSLMVRVALGVIALLIIIPVVLFSMAETKRRDQEKRLRALFELSPLGIALNDYKTGQFIELNNAMVKPTGYTKEEFRNLSYWEITPKKYESQEALQLEYLEKTGRYGPYEKEYTRKDGSTYPVLLNGVLISDSNGRKFIWSIVEDISIHKKHEKKLIRERNKAQAAAKAKSEFLATISHELRTPMNGVLGMLNLLSRTPLDPTQKRKLTVAQESGSALLKLIEDILDFAKVDSGKLELEIIDFDLLDLLESIAGSFEVEAENKSIALNLTLPELENQIVKGDPNRLRQILTNLISNAIKFTAEGSVTITCDLIDKKSHLEFIANIKDTGVGIAAQEQAKLFQSFSQVDSSSTREHGGSGLGLAICKKLCNLMQGDLQVKSRLGEGSQFTFDVHLEKSKATELPGFADLPKSEKLDWSQDKAVLLVEDIPFNQEVAMLLLAELGIKSQAAANGEKAIKLLSEGKVFDLILMDCEMPEMDGYETTRKIRAGEAGSYNKDIPIIAMTANALEDDREKCLRVGMNDYLSKPIEGDALERCLKHWLTAKRELTLEDK